MREPQGPLVGTDDEGSGTRASPSSRRAWLCRAVVDRNADEGVTWVHSYVSDDRKRTFCVYDAPTPEAIRKTAASNELPVDRITEVRVLDPYFYMDGR
ncbi:MAG: DUF4242 domain-containing protein [Actinobacteria bacterium]|nr:MAG: DUF4242 domain-containing protein [Actinomycetota bacterium]